MIAPKRLTALCDHALVKAERGELEQHSSLALKAKVPPQFSVKRQTTLLSHSAHSRGVIHSKRI